MKETDPLVAPWLVEVGKALAATPRGFRPRPRTLLWTLDLLHLLELDFLPAPATTTDAAGGIRFRWRVEDRELVLIAVKPGSLVYRVSGPSFDGLVWHIHRDHINIVRNKLAWLLTGEERP